MAARRRNPLTTHIRTIRKAVTAINRAMRRLSDAARGAGRTGQKRKRKLKLTPDRRAALKLQGAYMGYLRNLPAKAKARVKKVRAEKGIRAAIGTARRLGRR